ncbi:MAG TPA: helix-turn-helix transcriptional regulator [Pseudonocardiaceae bacterium]
MAADPMVQRRRLRTELRTIRVAAGLRQADVAGEMDWSPSKIIRIETGQTAISTSDLLALLAYYGVTDRGRVQALVELARSSRASSFYDGYIEAMPPTFRTYLAFEEAASVLRLYDPTFLPGLVQTERYAKVVLRDVIGCDADMVDQRWEVREHRQEQLHQRPDGPPAMIMVVDEAAVRRWIGGPAVMIEQLLQLGKMAELEHVHLRVLPFTAGAHAWLNTSVSLLEFDDPSLDDMVFVDDMDSEVQSGGDDDTVPGYLAAFDHLVQQTMPAEDGLSLIADELRRLRRA